jgi:hypothetical protein
MAIDNVPAVQGIIEQSNMLERAFHKPLDARLAYSRLADQEIFPNGIGETFTKTRPALFPLALSLTAMNPASNTGLDNGLTDNYYAFEQYQIGIQEYANSTTVNIMQDRTLIERIFMRNVVALGEHAGRTMDGLCSQQVHQNYDAGNTFSTAAYASGVTTIHVDNVKGFDTAFSATNSPGLPTPVSGANKISASVYDGTTGVLKGAISVSAATPDGSNTSLSLSGGVAYGNSGNLTVTATTFTIAINDSIIASDGAYVRRAGGKFSRANMTVTDNLKLIDIANAVSKLRARNVPALPSGNYACIIDPTLWPQLLSDTAFNYATMGQMGEGYFKTGLVSRTLGVEFVDSNLVPTFVNGSVNLRHAVVGGMGLLVQGTFQGSIDAAKQGNTMDNGDIRLVDGKVSMITRGPLDRLQEFVTQSWRWVGGFVSPTDVTSTNLVIPTTDAARYKRAVVIECGSSV